jgi:hypothetical protein
VTDSIADFIKARRVELLLQMEDKPMEGEPSKDDFLGGDTEYPG